MPYIDDEQRDKIYSPKRDGAIYSDCVENCGELNFAISILVRNYWDNKGKRYQAINDILGALEGAKLEFYRRVAVPYEEQKIKENGDIY